MVTLSENSNTCNAQPVCLTASSGLPSPHIPAISSRDYQETVRHRPTDCHCFYVPPNILERIMPSGLGTGMGLAAGSGSVVHVPIDPRISLAIPP
jgi:hypothetical protein